MIDRRNILKSIFISIVLIPFIKNLNFNIYKPKTIKIKKSDDFYWILSSKDI